MDANNGANPVRAIVTVSQFCQRTRKLLETDLGSVWIGGEVASISAPASGHWYLVLKDDRAQIRCVMFRQANIRCRQPKVGDEVLVSGRASLYEARGEMQLILNHLEQRGSGMLFQQFEALKARLQAEGLFESSRKQAVPALPRRIAVVTSPTGAAIQDIRRVFEKHRFDGLLRIYPAQVQGSTAPAQLIAALKQVDADANCDLRLLTRGGGSSEDLFCGTDEQLARTLANLKLPVISAVGHETDSTISDFVADLACATPTAGAEQILARWSRLEEALPALQRGLHRNIRIRMEQAIQRLDELQRRVAAPARQIELFAERNLGIQRRLQSAATQQRQCHQQRLQHLNARLAEQSPGMKLQKAQARLQSHQQLLSRVARDMLSRPREQLVRQARFLEAVSPLATLGRGYSLIRNEKGQVVRTQSQVATGDKLSARLYEGELSLQVLEKS